MKRTLLLLLLLPGLICHNLAMANIIRQYNGKPTPDDIIEIYAHRGGRALVAENTLPAYQTVLRLGVDYIDMDINMTQDGVLVVTHDLMLNPNITRDRQGQWLKKPIPIYQLTLKQLQYYDVGSINPNSDYASLFPMQYQMNGVHIPTLKQVIDYTKAVAGDRVGFQIEIKNDPTRPTLSASPKQYAKALDQLLKQEQVIDRTEVQAFDFQTLIDLNKMDPEIKTAYLTTNSHHQQLTDTVWTAGYNIKDYDNSYPKLIKSLGGSAWGPYEVSLTSKDLKEAHNLGLKVVVWGWPEQEKTTFNYPVLSKLINLGIDGIITDRPDQLRAILSARAYNLPHGFFIKNNDKY